MADDNELVDFNRPSGDERLQRPAEGVAVDRDVQPRIVGEIDGRVAEFVRDRRAMVMVLPPALQIAHA